MTPALLTFLCTMDYKLYYSCSYSICLLFTAGSAHIYFYHYSLTFLLYFYLLYWHLSSHSALLHSGIIFPPFSATFFSTFLHSDSLQSNLIIPLSSIFSTLISQLSLLYNFSSLHITAQSDRIGLYRIILDQLSLDQLALLCSNFRSSGLNNLSYSNLP